MTSFNEVTGVLDRTQFPDALLLDGSRQLADDLLVAPGVKIDGIDISAFNSLYQYHLGDPLAHGYVTNILDDSNQAVERNPLTNAVRIYGSDGILVTQTEYGLRVSGSGIGGGGFGFGIKDNIGSGAVPDGLGYITFTSDSSMTILSAGNGVALSVVPGNILHQALGERSKNDHHLAFIGLTVGATSVAPNGSDKILLAAGSNVVLTPSASTVTIALSPTPTFTGLTVSGNLSITGTVDGVDVSVLSTDVIALDASLDALLIDFAAHQAATSAHSSATAAHGATGAVVGTTNTQTLTSKTLVSPIFAPATATVPFTLSANGRGQTVTGLSSDLLDGQHGSYYTNASNLASGILLDARLSSNVARKDQANTWAENQTISKSLLVSDTVAKGLLTVGNPTSGPTVYLGRMPGQPTIKGDMYLILESNTHFLALNYYGSQPVILAYGGGNVGVGTNNPTSRLHVDGTLFADGYTHIRNAGEQLRLSYDANNYASLTVGTANLNLGVRGASNAIGSLTLDVENVFPQASLGTSLGSATKKYLSLHASELWVSTLVSQDVIATVGGRLLVGPTTELTRDINTTQTLLYFKHNNLANGDFVYLETPGKIEFIQIASASTSMAEGDYRYTVVRNRDGTGGNTWYAGDAVFNTGTTNDGWIDLYADSSMSGSTQSGPSIVGNVRTGTTWNLWEPRWAVGNLKGIYGYGASTYGGAFGDPNATNLTIDDSNGIRIRNGASTIASWDAGGTIVIGNPSLENAQFSSTGIRLRNGSSVYLSIIDAGVTVGSSGEEHVLIDSVGVRLRDNTTTYAQFAATTIIGEVANSKSRIEITSGAINIINRNSVGADTTSISLSSSGSASFTGTITASAGSITGALTLGASGGIYQGTGTFASPTTGLKIWSDSSVGRIAGYNAGTIQWYAGTDGRLYAGAGNVKLDQDGLTILGGGSSWSSVTWVSSSGTMGNVYGSEVTGSPSYVNIGISVVPNPTYKAGMAYLETTHYDDFPVSGFYQSRASVRVRSDSSNSGSVTLHGSSVVINTSTTTTSQRALFGTEGTILNGWVRGNQAGNSLRIDTGSGWMDIGARNTSWAHFFTDRANFYFNVPIHVNNSLSSYNNNLLLQRAGSTKLTLTSSGASVTGDLLVSGDVKNLINLDANTIYGGDSWSTLSSAAHMGKSLYTQSLSSHHLISMFSDGWSHLSVIAFGAYPVAPKPVASSYLATGNMRYLGGSYAGSTQAGVIAFAGNGGRFYFRTSAPGLSNHADIAWTDVMNVGSAGLDVLGAITGSSLTTTGALTGSHIVSNSTTENTFYGPVAARSSGASGWVRMVSGNVNNPGLVEWYRKNGTTRIGYIGYSTGGENNLAIVLENSAQLRVIGGNMGINADPGSYRLRVNGNTYFDGDQTVTGIMSATGTLVIPDGGTVTTPSISFEGDSNTGFYRWAGDSWSLVAGGVSLISMTSNRIDLKEELGDWVALPFASGWSNHGGSWNTGQYKRVGDLVFLRGLVTASSWNTTPTIATLPLGFRPLNTAMFACIAHSNQPARVDVNTDGTVRWVGGGSGTTWISLNNIVISTK